MEKKAHFKLKKMNELEKQYLNEGKGCALWGMILVVVIIVGACIVVYTIANK